MKILFISQFAGSPALGMVTRNYNWGIEWQKQGHDVTIIGASYSHYRNGHPDMQGHTLKHETIDGLRYLWVKTNKYNGDSALGRIKAIGQFLWRLQSVLKAEPKDYDIVIASSPHPFQVYQAKKFADQCGAKFIYDVRDMWPLTLKTIGNMSAWHPFIMALQHAENYGCRHADLLTSVPRNAENYFIDRGLRSDAFLPIGNGYLQKEEIRAIHLPDSHRNLLMQLRQNNAFIVGYCGTLGLANAMHSAVEAIAKADDNIHLVLMGDGHQKQSLKTLAHDKGVVGRVHFLDPVGHQQIPDFLSFIDAAYIGAMHSDLYQYGASPAKMNDYLSNAKPVIYTIGDPHNPVEQSQCGVSCHAEDSEAIAAAMEKLRNMDAQDLKAMGQRGKNWLYDNQLISIQVQKILDKLALSGK